VLAGSAGSARIAQLQQQAERRQTASFKVRSSLLTAFGSGMSAINAGPTLVADGAYVREDAGEGWAIDAVDDPAHKLLMHDWINRRNPRSAIGVRKDGVILLVTVDGHDHASSVGLTIEELRRLFGFLHARDAANLDGGGSAAIYLRDRLINHPSDASGERAVGDAILLRPADPAIR
jgi:exopolysaccharide biosynthesis protein